jgi:hypothetical protein
MASEPYIRLVDGRAKKGKAPSGHLHLGLEGSAKTREFSTQEKPWTRYNPSVVPTLPWGERSPHAKLEANSGIYQVRCQSLTSTQALRRRPVP